MAFFKNKFLNLFRWQNILNNKKVLGKMPSNREIIKNTFDIAWPSAMESVFIALIGAVDMMMVGGLGKEAVSAVGICTQPKMIILCLIISLNIGLTVLISRRKGENNKIEANKLLHQAVMISIILSFILSLSGIIFARPFIKLAGANSDYINDAVTYFKIIMIGNFFYSIGLTITAAQRGIGNTKISMITNLTANIVNFIFNGLLIYGLFFFPKLGVKGAAIATALGNIVSMIIAVYSVSKANGFIQLRINKIFTINKKIIHDLFEVCLPTLIEQLFLRVGFLTYSKAVASLGTTEFSAHQVTMNIMTISFACGDGLQIAATSLVGQNLGAKRSDLAIIYSKIAQRIGILVAICLSLIISIFKEPILYLFIQDQAVINMAFIPMLFLSITVLFQVPQVITVGSLRGAGDVKFVAILMLLSVTLIRPSLAWILAHGLNLGLLGAWLALLLDQLTRYFASRWRFNQAKWTTIKL